MKIGHCKIVAVAFIVMVQLFPLAPVMACSYCPPAIKPPPVPVMSPPSTPTVPSPVSGSGKCPLDALKLGACADVLGGLVHLSLGDPSVNKCCPVLQGVLEIEAALCLCTTINLKVLNLNIALPLALELLVTCGINPPPGFTCPTL